MYQQHELHSTEQTDRLNEQQVEFRLGGFKHFKHLFRWRETSHRLHSELLMASHQWFPNLKKNKGAHSYELCDCRLHNTTKKRKCSLCSAHDDQVWPQRPDFNTTSPVWGGGAGLYSSSLSYSGAVCCAGLSTVRAGTWLSDDSSFSVLEPGGAVFMGGVTRAVAGETK